MTIIANPQAPHLTEQSMYTLLSDVELMLTQCLDTADRVQCEYIHELITEVSDAMSDIRR